jgi:hypothetical protein
MLFPSANPWSKYHVQNQETPGSNCGVKDRDKMRQEGDWKITPKNKYEKITTCRAGRPRNIIMWTEGQKEN